MAGRGSFATAVAVKIERANKSIDGVASVNSPAGAATGIANTPSSVTAAPCPVDRLSSISSIWYSWKSVGASCPAIVKTDVRHVAPAASQLLEYELFTANDNIKRDPTVF